MPSGMRRSGRQLPTRGSDSSPLVTLSPAFSPSGARMYVFSPSSYCTSAMRAERFGSYSMATTVPGGPSLRRLKSMTRYLRLCPPPRKRVQMTPWLFRPPFLGLGRSRDFSGFFLRSVRSLKSLTDPSRRPGVVGLYWRIPMTLSFLAHSQAETAKPHGLQPVGFPGPLRGLLEEFNMVFRVQRNDGLFPVGHRADPVAPAPL